jgi:hypothetical protein
MFYFSFYLKVPRSMPFSLRTKPKRVRMTKFYKHPNSDANKRRKKNYCLLNDGAIANLDVEKHKKQRIRGQPEAPCVLVNCHTKVQESSQRRGGCRGNTRYITSEEICTACATRPLASWGHNRWGETANLQTGATKTRLVSFIARENILVHHSLAGTFFH